MNLRKVTNFRNSINDCPTRGVDPAPVHYMQCSPNGFIGAYDPDPVELENKFNANSKGTFDNNVTASIPGYKFRRLLATSNLAGSTISGIANPVTCLRYGEIIFFEVTLLDYPVYDR